MECNSEASARPERPPPGRLACIWERTSAVAWSVVVLAAMLIAVYWLGIALYELLGLLDAALDYVLETGLGAPERPAKREVLSTGAMSAGADLVLAAFFLVLTYGLLGLGGRCSGGEGPGLPGKLGGFLRAVRDMPHLWRHLLQLILLMLALKLFAYGYGVALDGQGPGLPERMIKLGVLAVLIVAALYVAVRGGIPWRVQDVGRWQARRQFFVRLPIYTALGLFVLVANPYGIGDVTDKATQNALYRVFAPAYDREGNLADDDAIAAGRDGIVVVLLDENAIEQLHERKVITANEWPILYRDHANILSRILSYRPRALFVDVHFKKQRVTDDSLDSMIARLDRAKPAAWDGLLFAGGYASERAAPIRDELARVGRLRVTGWEGHGDAYPLQVNHQPTAAYELYRIARCQGPAPAGSACYDDAQLAEQAALSVRWGSSPAAPVLPSLVSETCKPAPGHWFGVLGEMAGRALGGLLGANVHTDRQRCPYHRTLFAHELVYVDRHGTADEKRALDEALRDSIVLYGVALSGLRDSVVSPVHGRLPGVMFHAMALDNLLVDGDAYTRAAGDAVDWLNAAVWFLLVLALCLVLYRVEVRESDLGTPCERRRRHSRWRIWSLGFVVVVGVSLASFFALDYEPVNAVGFMALGAVVGQLVHSDLSGKVLRAYDCYQRCSDAEGECASPCAQERCKGGGDDVPKNAT